MPLPATYASGTITVAANGATVTGAGTNWLAGGTRAGDVLEARGLSVSIKSVEGAGALTLVKPWPGTALSASAYEIRYTPDASRVLAASRAALEKFEGADTRKNNLTATRAPLPTDDASQGYGVGSRWLWQGREWVATDVSAGAADWVDLSLAAAEETSGRSFASVVAISDATILPVVSKIDVVIDGVSLRYTRGTSSNGAIQSADGAWWRPDGVPTPDHFGARRNDPADDTAAILAAINYAKAHTGVVQFLSGRYTASELVLDSVRGLRLVGAAPGTEVFSNDDTYIQLASGSTQEFLVDFRSCSYVEVENITFWSNGATADNLVRFTCNGESTTSPRSPFASTGVECKSVVFAVSNTAPMNDCTVSVADFIMGRFIACNFSGPVAIRLGKDSSIDPATGEPTIPDGRVVNTLFDRCIFRGDIVRYRTTNITWRGCYFGRNTKPASGSLHQVSRLQTGGNEEIRGDVLANNSIDSDAVGYAAGVWYDTPASPPPNINPSLVAYGNQITSVGVAFRLRSGSAKIFGNSFSRVTMPGAATYVAVDVQDGVTKIDIGPNNYDGLMMHNAGSITSYAVRDNRTAREDERVVLRRQLSADTAFTNNNWRTIATRTLPHFDGGIARISFEVTISAAIASAFNARIRIDSFIVPGATARFITTSAEPTTFKLSVSGLEAYLPPSLRGAPVAIVLEAQQSAGSTYATIRSDAYGYGSSWARLEMVTS